MCPYLSQLERSIKSFNSIQVAFLISIFRARLVTTVDDKITTFYLLEYLMMERPFRPDVLAQAYVEELTLAKAR